MHNKSHVISLKYTKPEEPEAVPPPPQLPPERPRKKTALGLFIAAATVIVVLAVGVYLQFFKDAEVSESQPTNSNAEDLAEVEGIVAAVGKLIVLPEGEEPTVATVTDPTKLGSELFFQNAKRGDKVLIYTGARKAYLYDPLANKLIEVAPITTQ